MIIKREQLKLDTLLVNTGAFELKLHKNSITLFIKPKIKLDKIIVCASMNIKRRE